MDYMVCNLEDCEKKTTCWRYHKYKSLKGNFAGFITVYEPLETPKQCSVYVDIKEKYNNLKNTL